MHFKFPVKGELREKHLVPDNVKDNCSLIELPTLTLWLQSLGPPRVSNVLSYFTALIPVLKINSKGAITGTKKW